MEKDIAKKEQDEIVSLASKIDSNANTMEALSTLSSDNSNYIEEGKKTVEITSEWVLAEISKAKGEVLENAKVEINKQVQTDKSSLITVFGVFASVISFLTIEFQFLKTVCSLEKILGFTLILFSLLFGFNIALDYLVKSRLEKETPRPNIYFSIFIFLLLVAGIYMTFNGNEEICKDNKIYQRYSDQFETNFQDLNNGSEKRLNIQDDKINNIMNEIDMLKIQKQ